MCLSTVIEYNNCKMTLNLYSMAEWPFQHREHYKRFLRVKWGRVLRVANANIMPVPVAANIEVAVSTTGEQVVNTLLVDEGVRFWLSVGDLLHRDKNENRH